MQQKGAGLIITNPAPKRSDQMQIVSLLTSQNANCGVPRESRARMEDPTKRMSRHHGQEPQSNIGYVAMQS